MKSRHLKVMWVGKVWMASGEHRVRRAQLCVPRRSDRPSRIVPPESVSTHNCTIFICCLGGKIDIQCTVGKKWKFGFWGSQFQKNIFIFIQKFTFVHETPLKNEKKVKHVTGVFFTVTTRPKLFVLINAMIFVFWSPLLKKNCFAVWNMRFFLFFTRGFWGKELTTRKWTWYFTLNGSIYLDFSLPITTFLKCNAEISV